MLLLYIFAVPDLIRFRDTEIRIAFLNASLTRINNLEAVDAEGMYRSKRSDFNVIEKTRTPGFHIH